MDDPRHDEGEALRLLRAMYKADRPDSSSPQFPRWVCLMFVARRDQSLLPNRDQREGFVWLGWPQRLPKPARGPQSRDTQYQLSAARWTSFANDLELRAGRRKGGGAIGIPGVLEALIIVVTTTPPEGRVERAFKAMREPLRKAGYLTERLELTPQQVRRLLKTVGSKLAKLGAEPAN